VGRIAEEGEEGKRGDEDERHDKEEVVETARQAAWDARHPP
jgi:hypothetical protein